MRYSQRTLFVAVLATATCIFAAKAFANARVTGKITGFDKLVPDVYAEAAKDPHRYSWRDVSPTVAQQFKVLSDSPSREICMAAFTPGDQPAHEPVLVKVTGGRTTPATIVVSPGTHLAFKNADPFPHRLYQVNEPKWPATSTNPNSQRDWTATTPGKFEIRDELFPSVRMYIVVDKQVIDFVYPDRDGGFALNLPQGDYVLKAFFGGKQVGHDINGIHVGNKEAPVDIKDPLTVGGDSK
jgi:plastocyanin